MKNPQLLLAARPDGPAKPTDFRLAEAEVPPLTEGQVLVRIEVVSIDPAIRGWMNAGTTYIPGSPLGAPMRCFAAGRVADSKNPRFTVGEAVEGLLGTQTYALSDGSTLRKLDLVKGPLSYHLGILGMPGLTAYFGLLDKGKPVSGETVFVSAAAGMIGSTVGQIAKIKGCRAVGSAGGPEKCRYLLDLGFDAAIDYKSENVAEALKTAAPDGLHVYFDNVGGEQLDAALLNLARGARVVLCGSMSQYNNPGGIQGPKNYMKIVTARGLMTGLIVFDYFDRYDEAVSDLSAWLASGQVKYREHVVEGLENFPTALQMLFTGENFGKLVLKIV